MSLLATNKLEIDSVTSLSMLMMAAFCATSASELLSLTFASKISEATSVRMELSAELLVKIVAPPNSGGGALIMDLANAANKEFVASFVLAPVAPPSKDAACTMVFCT